MSVVSIAEAWPSPGKPFGAQRPFTVEVVPARLVAGLPPPA